MLGNWKARTERCQVDDDTEEPEKNVIGQKINGHYRTKKSSFRKLICPITINGSRVRTPPGKSLKLLEFNSYPGMSWNMLKNQIELLKTP